MNYASLLFNFFILISITQSLSYVLNFVRTSECFIFCQNKYIYNVTSGNTPNQACYKTKIAGSNNNLKEKGILTHNVPSYIFILLQHTNMIVII